MAAGKRGRERNAGAKGRDAIEEQHRAEWTAHRASLAKAIDDGDSEKLKLAKLVAEIGRHLGQGR